MSEWTSEKGRKRLCALLDAPVGPDGPTVFGGGDMRELLDALEEAEEQRDDALAKKRALEDVAASFGWKGSLGLATWAAIQAQMAREHGELLRRIEAVAREHGYDAVESEDSVLERFERICRERNAMRAALRRIEKLGFHIAACYVHVEHEPDDPKPRCVTGCPTAEARVALSYRP